MKYATYVEYRDKKKVNDHKIYLNTGVNTSTLSAWKNGEYVPKMDKQALIADYLKIPKSKLWEQDAEEEIEVRRNEALHRRRVGEDS